MMGDRVVTTLHTCLIIGARASTRGAAGFSALAGVKAALRQLAHSLAREMGPKGIHVAHVVIDGMIIDGTFARSRVTDIQPLLDGDDIRKPDEIARNYVWLHNQQRSAWTFEMDLRPFKEIW